MPCGDPWELLYAYDLILTAESMKDVIGMFRRWKEALEMRGMKVNLSNTKLLVTGKEAEITLACKKIPKNEFLIFS